MQPEHLPNRTRWADHGCSQGFILGEGFLSIINLMMQAAGVPHL